jgi:hypothetical protein
MRDAAPAARARELFSRSVIVILNELPYQVRGFFGVDPEHYTFKRERCRKEVPPLASYFEHPLWRPFHGRHVWVLSLSEPEHRLRDARALLCLRDFLPAPSFGMCTYATVTINGGSPPTVPTIPQNAGVVVIARPGLFGGAIKKVLDQSKLYPPLMFEFGDDRPDHADYRAIRVPGGSPIRCPSFAEQKTQRRAPEEELRDYAIVYVGASDGRPVMLLAGTSSVGTWGAVRYVTTWPSGSDERWREHIQGVVEVTVNDRREAFEEVSASPYRAMLSPCEIWMEGADLTSILADRDLNILWEPDPGASPLDLRMFINGRQLFEQAPEEHFGAAVLLAWARVAGREGGKAVSADAICEYLFTRFYQRMVEQDCRNGREFKAKYQSKVFVKLDRLVGKILEAGGIAEKLSEDGRALYRVVAKPLPHFLRD